MKVTGTSVDTKIEEQIQLLEDEKKKFSLLIDKHINTILLPIRYMNESLTAKKTQILRAKMDISDYHINASKSSFLDSVWSH